MGGGRNVGVTEDAGNRSYIDAVFNSPGRKGVSQSMKFHVRQFQFGEGFSEIGTQIVRIHVVADPVEDDEISMFGGFPKLPGETAVLVLHQILQYLRQIDDPVRGIGFCRGKNHFGPVTILGVCFVFGNSAYRFPKVDATGLKVIIPPPQGAYLAQTCTGEHGNLNGSTFGAWMFEKPVLQNGLVVIGHGFNTVGSASLENGERHRVGMHIAIRHSTLAAHIENHAHILHALGAEGAAVAEISAGCCGIEEPLDDSCTHVIELHGSQGGENVLVKVVVVVLIATGLGYRLDIGFKPVVGPLRQGELRVEREGEKQIIQAHAAQNGESVNAFLNRAVTETMERDLNKQSE